MQKTEKPNIKKLTDYINSQKNPVGFALALFTIAGLLSDDSATKNEILQCNDMHPRYTVD